MITRMPRPARCLAVSRPIPLVPPVTMATLPFCCGRTVGEEDRPERQTVQVPGWKRLQTQSEQPDLCSRICLEIPTPPPLLERALPPPPQGGASHAEAYWMKGPSDTRPTRPELKSGVKGTFHDFESHFKDFTHKISMNRPPTRAARPAGRPLNQPGFSPEPV